MNKVYFSVQAEQDLSDIVVGLIFWQKFEITEPEALLYADDIYDIALTIPMLSVHQKCKYQMHREYGLYQYSYRRNSRTIWYIIYNIDSFTNDILIEKIISNHTTQI
jgi:hypothetical protein